VSLTAPKNAVYTWGDGAAVAHPARKTGPVVTKGIKHSGDTWDPTVYYAKKVGVAWELTGIAPPTDAGTYAAVVVDHETQLSASSVAAYVIYTIDKAVQPAPVVEGVAVVDTNNDQKVQVQGTVAPSTVLNKGGSDIETKYQVFYYTSGGVTPGAEQDVGTFEPPVALTNYYVEVWYSEGANYYSSVRTRTYPVFVVGNTKIHFSAAEGVGYTPHTVNSNTEFTIDVFAKEGYYLTENFATEVIYPDNHPSDEKTVEINAVDGKVREKYSITNVPNQAGLEITINLSGAALKTGITATVAEKREYDAVLDPSVTVSRDSAFTMAFEITNYNPAVYSGLKLTMEKVLPIGSTILMMDKSEDHTTYWAYKVETENLQEVPLNSFVRMGGTGNFAEPTGIGVLTDPLCYQFIVDCSWSNGASVGDLGMKLTAGKKVNDDTVTPEFAGLYEAPTVSLAEKETFALENIAETTQGEMRQSLKFNYTAAGGAASCWEGRAPALVLTLPKTSQVKLPADTQLKYTFRPAGDGRILTRITSFLSSGGKQYFIMPLIGLVPGEKFPSQVDLVLQSDTFPIDATTYSFHAQWIYSRSGNAESPMDGDMVAEATAEFAKSKTFVPNVTVSTANDKRLYTPGETLHLSISSNIDSDFEELTSFKVELLRKVEGGSYATTAWNEYVGGNSTVDILLSPELTPGSYCVRTTVIYANQTALQVPFYFVIQKADGAVPDTGGNSTTGGDPTTGEIGGNGNEATGETGNEAGTNG